MRTLTSMIEKLSPLGVYKLTKDSVVYAELAAFAAGLEILRDTLDTILKESFIVTAEDFGIENLERLVGNVRSDLPIGKRREMLIERLSLNYCDFTPKGFEKMLRLIGVEGSIEEYPENERIVLNLSEGAYNEAQREWIVSQARALLPAHIEWDVVFAGFNWETSDSLNNTFAQIDGKGYIWKKIDYLI